MRHEAQAVFGLEAGAPISGRLARLNGHLRRTRQRFEWRDSINSAESIALSCIV